MSKKLIFFLTVCLCVFYVAPVDAASLYIDPSAVTVKRGNSVTLSVRLDTDEATQECVNTISAVISYGQGIDPVDISTGDSILSMWVEEPVIDKDNRQIRFAGGIPNGYCGRVQGDPRLTNNIVDLVFRSPGFMIGGSDAENNAAAVTFTDETEIYLNDGFGTKADMTTFGSVITLSPDLGKGENDAWLTRVSDDERPPEDFSIALERDENGGVFGGRWYIVFNTDDKQTGIDHYEVIEETFAERNLFNWGAADAPWRVARSPYALQDQTLNSTISVKAIDKAGNIYIATLVPDESLRTASKDKYIIMALGGVGALVVIGAALLVFFYWRRSRSQEELDLEDDVTDYE